MSEFAELLTDREFTDEELQAMADYAIALPDPQFIAYWQRFSNVCNTYYLVKFHKLIKKRLVKYFRSQQFKD